jgi:hypothetical protein
MKQIIAGGLLFTVFLWAACYTKVRITEKAAIKAATVLPATNK